MNAPRVFKSSYYEKDIKQSANLKPFLHIITKNKRPVDAR